MPKILLLIAALLTGGCAAKKMVVKNADVIIEYQILKRLPLSSEQKKQLNKDIKAFLNNQKEFTKKSLPIISQIDLDPSKVDKQYEKLHEIYKYLSLEFSKIMAKHMAQLSLKQQEEFSSNLDSENRILRRLKSDDLGEKVQARIESLFGTITDKQIQLVKENHEFFESRNQVRLQRREELHKEFKEIYKSDTEKEAKEKAFYESFSKFQESYPNKPMNKEFIKKLLPSLNDDQKVVFKKKIKEIEEMIKYYLNSHY